MLKFFFPCALAILIGGCASTGKVENTLRSDDSSTQSYSLRTFQDKWRDDPNALMLAFSGGGTRAAALAYGVLVELRDTKIYGSENDKRLLDEVHSISSVSGGSFTAAYFGLHGDGIFDDFEQTFLRKNVQSALIHRLINPFRWFSGSGRTEMAIDYYEDEIFKEATFSDMLRPDGPFIMINATDLARGLRFSFIQDYFDLLCSDLSSFPVARAVAASSAVPVLFNPIVVENYSECNKSKERSFLQEAREHAEGRPELVRTVEGLASYANHDKRRYIHFVDGGISDNLGLRGIYEIIELSGGAMQYAERMRRTLPRRLVLISVNAAADHQLTMDQNPKRPSLVTSIVAVSSVQLNRYSTDTIALVEKSFRRWAEETSSPQQPVEPYFILLDFNGIEDPKQREFLNQTPTSFYLTDEQVDALIAAGGELLRNNSEYRRLMADLAADAQSESNAPAEAENK